MVRGILSILSFWCAYGCSVHSSFQGGRDSAAARKTTQDAVGAAAVIAEGLSGYAEQRDTFRQGKKGVLDILLVIDNSGSMKAEQAEVASNLPSLLKHVQNSDWRIAVISTDMDDCVSAPLTSGTTDYENGYRKAIHLGVNGSSTERYFQQAIKGLKGGMCKNTNTTWLREDSTVAVLIVGDDEGAQTCNCIGNSEKLIDYLKDIRPTGNARVYGLIGVEWNTLISGGYFAAHGYVDVSYDSTLRRISQDMGDTLATFHLSQEPSGAVDITVDTKKVRQAEYTVDGRRLKFDRGYVPPDRATIIASYRYLSD